MTAHLARRFTVIALSGSFVGACMTAKVDEDRQMNMSVGVNEGLVVLAKPQSDGAGTEPDFLDCVGKGLAGGARGFKIYDNDQFVDLMFPWFEPGTEPTRPEGLANLFQHQQVVDKLASTGVRYLVWVDGITKKTDGGGSFACGAAPGAAGCIGFGWWEKQSDYEATVWDLQQTRSAGSVSATVTGTSALVGVIVPLPFISRVQGTACNRLTGQLRTFLRGDGAVAKSSP